MRRWQPSEDACLALLLVGGFGGVTLQFIGIVLAPDAHRLAALGLTITLVSGLLFMAYRLSQES